MGYFLYSLTEIVMRGYTHWTMSLLGGTVLTILYGLSSRRVYMIRKCFSGALVITALELVVGIFDNIIMHWQVWDYSDMPLNFMGQICLPFSCFWFLLCIPAYRLCAGIRRRFEETASQKEQADALEYNSLLDQ